MMLKEQRIRFEIINLLHEVKQHKENGQDKLAIGKSWGIKYLMWVLDAEPAAFAFNIGYDAVHDDKKTNPYDPDTFEHGQWNFGYNLALEHQQGLDETT